MTENGLQKPPRAGAGTQCPVRPVLPCLGGDPGRIGATGQVQIGPGWRSLEASWYQGVAAIAGRGTGVILDEVLLDGVVGQDRLRGFFSGLGVLWVGVPCDLEVAKLRGRPCGPTAW